MTTDDAPLARMDVPAVRDAYIELRVCELRVLAAKTAVEFGRAQDEPLALVVKRAMKRAMKRRGFG